MLSKLENKDEENFELILERAWEACIVVTTF